MWCGGEGVAGESGRGCAIDELSGNPKCLCLGKKVNYNCELVFSLLQEMRLDGIHLTTDIAGKWAAFCTKLGAPGGKFARFTTMDPHVLRKAFQLMMKEADARNSWSVDFQHLKVVTPMDRLMTAFHFEILNAASLKKLKAAQKSEITSSKLHFERGTLGDEDEDDDEIYRPPKRKISMLQNKEDFDDSGSSCDGGSDDDNVGTELIATYTKGDDGLTTATMANKPQNGRTHSVPAEPTASLLPRLFRTKPRPSTAYRRMRSIWNRRSR